MVVEQFARVVHLATDVANAADAALVLANGRPVMVVVVVLAHLYLALSQPIDQEEEQRQRERGDHTARQQSYVEEVRATRASAGNAAPVRAARHAVHADELAAIGSNLEALAVLRRPTQHRLAALRQAVLAHADLAVVLVGSGRSHVRFDVVASILRDRARLPSRE